MLGPGQRITITYEKDTPDLAFEEPTRPEAKAAIIGGVACEIGTLAAYRVVEMSSINRQEQAATAQSQAEQTAQPVGSLSGNGVNELPAPGVAIGAALVGAVVFSSATNAARRLIRKYHLHTVPRQAGRGLDQMQTWLNQQEEN